MKQRLATILVGAVTLLVCLFAARPAVAAPNLDLNLTNFTYVNNDIYRLFLTQCNGTPIGTGFHCSTNNVCFAAGQVFFISGNGACTSPTALVVTCICNHTVANVSSKFLGTCCSFADGKKAIIAFNGGCCTAFRLFSCDNTAGHTFGTSGCSSNGTHSGNNCNSSGTGLSSVCNSIQLTVGGGSGSLNTKEEGTGAQSDFNVGGATITNISVATAPEVNVRSSGAPVFLSLGVLLVALDRRRKNVATH